jgi:hypothetical protein
MNCWIQITAQNKKRKTYLLYAAASQIFTWCDATAPKAVLMSMGHLGLVQGRRREGRLMRWPKHKALDVGGRCRDDIWEMRGSELRRLIDAAPSPLLQRRRSNANAARGRLSKGVDWPSLTLIAHWNRRLSAELQGFCKSKTRLTDDAKFKLARIAVDAAVAAVAASSESEQPGRAKRGKEERRRTSCPPPPPPAEAAGHHSARGEARFIPAACSLLIGSHLPIIQISHTYVSRLLPGRAKSWPDYRQ